jgi:hypothetical protein
LKFDAIIECALDVAEYHHRSDHEYQFYPIHIGVIDGDISVLPVDKLNSLDNRFGEKLMDHFQTNTNDNENNSSGRYTS